MMMMAVAEKTRRSVGPHANLYHKSGGGGCPEVVRIKDRHLTRRKAYWRQAQS